MSAARTRAGRPLLLDRRDLRLVGRQVGYEQLAFWRNPLGAGFTVVFSVVFLVLLGASGGKSMVSFLPGVKLIQYYVAGFAAYGVMAACFNMLAINLVLRRELGLLKRLRLSPLPRWIMFSGVFANALIVSAVQVVLLLIVGRYGYHAHLPHQWGALVVALLAGVFCFTALGVAVSTLIPNQEAAGPVLSIVFFVLLFLSGLWYPIRSGSALAKISTWFPVRHLITATFAPFHLSAGASPWAWHDVLVMAIWGVAGVYVALRRFRWEPRRG
ncbi:MAG TPA: ABC transporter permease [Acidimicrobiales bacterium]|jgi:ABC-2 type transport system permease protein